jgi:hypothetical protein
MKQVREPGGLLADPPHDLGMARADAGDGDPRGHVDELVSVDVDDDAALDVVDEHRDGDTEPGGHGLEALGVHLLGPRAGDLRPQEPALRRRGGGGGHLFMRFAPVTVCHGDLGTLDKAGSRRAWTIGRSFERGP